MTIHSFSEQPLDELAKALVKFQAEVGAIPKTSANPFFKSKYAGLPAVVETAGPLLAKHGLAVSQHISMEGDSDVLETWLLHTSGQYLVSRQRLHLTKLDSQGLGSAVTYARRYGYMAVLGLVADDDDDGNAASSPGAAPARAQSDRPKASPNKPMSEKQANMIKNLLSKQNLNPVEAAQARFGKHPNELTSADASAWIDEMMMKQDGTEPF